MSEIPIPEPDDASSPRSPGLLRGLQPLLTLLIAITAIALAAWEGIENRRHNHLSVLPRLDASIGAGREGGAEYVRMAVESTGLGPAVIRDFRIYFDGAIRLADDTAGGIWDEVIEAAASEGTQIHARAFGSGHYFPAGREYVLFEARRGVPAPEGAANLSAILDRLAIQVCYCSVYGTDCDQALLAATRVETVPCTGS